MNAVVALPHVDVTLDDTTRVDRFEFGGEWPAAWRVECGEWAAGPEGLVGFVAGDKPAVVWCTNEYPFDHAIGVRAHAVAPNTNDANGFFRGVGRIEGPDEHRCWIAGNAGWWQHDDGLEKHPSGPTWRVAGAPLPDAPVEFYAGVKDDVVFLFKDGRLVEARSDPDPLPVETFARVGLGTWDSEIRFLACHVFRI